MRLIHTLLFFVVVAEMVDSQNSTSAENAPPSERGWKNLQRYVMENRVDFGLWATRVITILFTIGYIIPIFGYLKLLLLYIHDATEDSIVYFAYTREILSKKKKLAYLYHKCTLTSFLLKIATCTLQSLLTFFYYYYA